MAGAGVVGSGGSQRGRRVTNNRFPLLIISDSVSCISGLGRMTRDLAKGIVEHIPEIELATGGYGGPGSARLPWYQPFLTPTDSWILGDLPVVWGDFANGRKGAILVIWDASRIGWLADPAMCPIPHLAQWLTANRGEFQKWLYCPVDAEGIGGRYPASLLKVMGGFDRILNYSAWAANVTGFPDHLPHGIDTKIFKPQPKWSARRRFREKGFRQLTQESVLVGIVATNQSRKDWALGMETIRLLVDRGVDVKLWCHTDQIRRYWDLGALVSDFGLWDRVAITVSPINDDELAWMYSACDVTLGIGLGEGFGFPIFESLACGTAVVHGDYGGAAEWLPGWMKVTPREWRYESLFNFRRPVFRAEDWAERVMDVVGVRDEIRLPEELDWNGEILWPRWEEWIRRGIK